MTIKQAIDKAAEQKRKENQVYLQAAAELLTTHIRDVCVITPFDDSWQIGNRAELMEMLSKNLPRPITHHEIHNTLYLIVNKEGITIKPCGHDEFSQNKDEQWIVEIDRSDEL